jgi:hypothetical protein
MDASGAIRGLDVHQRAAPSCEILWATRFQ